MDERIDREPERLMAFIETMHDSLGVERENRYLVEKDLYLTIILKELQKTDFHKNLVFKGGTCLAKAYLNYHRFSEDIDFTWKDQEIFKGKSMTSIRKICSGHINEVGSALLEISKKYGFYFKFEKHNRDYVQLGGSNKLVTFLIWFDSIEGRRSMIKIQINFLEHIEFPVMKKELKPLIERFPKKEEVYFSDFLGFYKDLNYLVYDIREIACEKIRALLTRKTINSKDLVDLYLIHKNFGIDVFKLNNSWVKKTKFAIEIYEKYKENFEARTALTLESAGLDKVENLLLTEIDKNDFEIFVTELLNKLKNETIALFNE